MVMTGPACAKRHLLRLAAQVNLVTAKTRVVPVVVVVTAAVTAVARVAQMTVVVMAPVAIAQAMASAQTRHASAMQPSEPSVTRWTRRNLLCANLPPKRMAKP